ncbi:MAG: hypothetical protein ACTSR0_03975 [Candidatus Asgardarchaeia archaeon]
MLTEEEREALEEIKKAEKEKLKRRMLPPPKQGPEAVVYKIFVEEAKKEGVEVIVAPLITSYNPLLKVIEVGPRGIIDVAEMCDITLEDLSRDAVGHELAHHELNVKNEEVWETDMKSILYKESWGKVGSPLTLGLLLTHEFYATKFNKLRTTGGRRVEEAMGRDLYADLPLSYFEAIEKGLKFHEVSRHDLHLIMDLVFYASICWTEEMIKDVSKRYNSWCGRKTPLEYMLLESKKIYDSYSSISDAIRVMNEIDKLWNVRYSSIYESIEKVLK